MSALDKYSKEQAAAILERAAELQEEGASSGRSQVSLRELEEIAQEAGISTALVRRAANELPERRPDRAQDSFLLGGPKSIVLEQVVDGEVPLALHEHLIETVRRETGELGGSEVLGNTLSWSSVHCGPDGVGYRGGSGRIIHLTVAPRQGVTTVRLEESLASLAGGLFGGIMGGLGGGGIGLVVAPLSALGTPAIILPLGVAVWIGGTYAATRSLFRRKSKTRQRELERVMGRILDVVDSLDLAA